MSQSALISYLHKLWGGKSISAALLERKPVFAKGSWLKIKDGRYADVQSSGGFMWGSRTDLFIKLKDHVFSPDSREVSFYTVNFSAKGKLEASEHPNCKSHTYIVDAYEAVVDESTKELLQCLLTNEIAARIAERKAHEDKRITDHQKLVAAAIKKTKCVEVDNES